MRKIYSMLLALVLFSAANINAQNVTVSGAVTGNGSYATLGAAFTAIGTAQPAANIVIDIVGNTNEGATVATLGAGTWATITIQPSGGAARTITGAPAGGNPLIDLAGADNVTINGLNTGGNSLTISNTTVSGTSNTSTIRFITDAVNNTITNCSILGSSTMTVATNGGNILFAAGAVSTGNDNNTISNCNIGPAGTNLPTKGIHCGGSSNTDPGTANSGLVFSGNNIFDYFSATVPSAGIYITSGTVGTSITNNKFYQSATRTQTTAGQHSAVWITNTSGNNYSVTGNTIGFANASGTGTYAFTGVGASVLIPIFINVGTTTASNINNNTIAGIAMSGSSSGTGSTAAFRCIYVSAGLTICNNNTIGSQSATGSITFTSSSTSAADIMGIYNFGSSTWTTTGNTVGGITVTNSSTGAANIYALRCNTGSGVNWTCTNNTVGGTIANSIQSNSTSTATTVQGIRNENPIGTFTGNTIRNLSTLAGTGTTTSASVIGICVSTGSSNQTIGQNTIFNLSNTNATTASIVTGIQFTGSTSNIVERNLIYALTVSTTSTSAEVNGIRVGGGTTTYRNNMIALGAGIGNAIGAAASNSGTTGINGFNGALGTDNFYHNSIYIGGTATAGTGASFAFNGTQTTNTRAFRDNIFFNARTNSGATGKHYAVKINGTAANPAGLTINNNLYFVNGSGGVFGFFNGADVASLAAWKTAVGQDANSFEGNPQYLDPTNATPDLHINPSITTAAEGNGVSVGVTDDYDGQTRSGLTPTDIGADAGNFTGADLTPPVISFTPLSGTCVLTGVTLTATITDAGSGVPTSGAGLPVLYWNVNGGAYSAVTGSFVSGNTYSFGPFGNGIVGDVIRYYIVAQDGAATPNVTSNPAAGAGGFTANPPAAATPPTTPGIFNLQNSIGGTYTVGSGGNYATITAAVAAYNSSCLTSAVVFNLTDAAYTGETFPITINANSFASSTNTLTIKTTQAATTITGSSASALFVLNGADYVTIDGSISSTANTVCPASSASRDLTLTNTNTGTSSAVVWLQTTAGGADAATNNAVINCNLVGNSNTTTLFAVGAGSTTISTTSTGTSNNNNSFVNNNISKTQFGIYSGGASAGNKNTGTVINQNLINTVSPNNVGLGGILVSFENNITISGNTISEINGTADRFGISAGFGISFSGATTVSSEVTNATITNNIIGNVIGTGTNSSFGIALGAATSGTSLIANNFVYGVSHNSTSPDIAAGIAVGGGTGSTTNIFHNTVSMQGTITGGTAAVQTSACLAVTATTAPTLVDVRNNIFSNTQANNSGTTMRFTAIALGYSSTLGNYSGLTSNNNDLFAAGSLGTYTIGITGGVTGTNRTTLTAWTTETGKDGASVNILPVFTSTSDLHLVPASNVTLNSLGTALSVTNDIDCETRSLTTPDMGADEFAAPDCTGATGGTAAGDITFCGSGTPTITASGYSSGNTTTYQWYSSTVIGDYPNAGTAVSGQTNPASLTTGVVSTTTYYWLRVTCTAASATDNSTMVTVTVNPLPAAVTVSGAGTFCTSTTITATGGTGGTIYFQGTTANGTSTTTASTSESITTSGTYYFRAQTALGCWGTEGSAAVTIQTPAGITGTNANICAGGAGSLQATATNCTGFVNSGLTLSGTFTAGDAQALRPTTSIVNTATCSFDATIQRGYQAQQFQVSVTGSYTFDMTSTDDGMAYITTGAFVPGNCSGGGTWVRGDDDNGPGNDPQLAMTLTAGVTYTLYSTTYGTVTGNSTAAYSWTITPPSGGQIMLPATGTIQWYTVASGGTSIGTGSPFNPVGVANSGLANTNTPGTTPYYAACSLSSACRTQVDFIINPNYDIVATSGANGSVTPAGTTTLSCDGTGDQTYTITPDPGYLISDLIVDGVGSTPLTTGTYATGGTYDFINVTANHTISATFAVACVNVGITNVSASNPGPLCSGQTTNLTANGVVGTNAVVNWWTGPNGTGTNLGTGTTLNNVGANTYYARVTGDCGTPAEASITINSTGNIFTGTGNWSDNARWSCGAPPASGDAVTIASGANATLDVNFTVSGSLTMDATSTLIVNPTRTLAVDVAATANFNGQSVTFLSDATGTASLGQVNGTLSGATNVTVERYIPNNGFRSWRLLSVPVTTSQTIRQAWQEGDANPLPQQNNLAGRGTQITGVFGTQAAAAAAGFDSTSVQAGMLRWNGASWSNITSTNQPINNFSSYFLYIRGERSRSVTGAVTNASATTLRTTGTVFTGDQTNSVGANAFALIPNRYPSAINFTGLTRTGGVNNLFYIWDSKKLNGQSLGAYQTFSGTNGFICLLSGGSYTLGQPNTTIESGQSFFVTSSTSGTIVLKESAKVSGTNGSLGFRPSAIRSKIDTRLYNHLDEMLDANTVVFDAVYSKAVADEDAPKMGNPGANFAIETDSKLLAVEGTAPVKENDAIQFRMWNMTAGTYKLELALSNLSLPAGTSAILEDSYLKTSTVLNTSTNNSVSFTVDANKASSAANRFRVVIAKAASINTKAGFSIAPNPIETGVMNVVFSNQVAGKYSVRIVSAAGQLISAYRLTHAGGNANHLVTLPAVMGNGTYSVEITSPAKTRTIQTILVNRK